MHVVTADDAALAAFGSNVLDPATREPSARAGRAQAAATLEAARAFWGGPVTRRCGCSPRRSRVAAEPAAVSGRRRRAPRAARTRR